MKKMVSLLLCMVMVTMGLTACGSSVGEGDTAEEVVYRQMYSSDNTTLNYLTTGTIEHHRIGANTVDTLIEYDSKGNLVPSLATEWKISEDGLTYTFTLREGQKWVDYTGAEVADVTAADFVDAMKYVLTPEYESGTAQNLFGIIKNAEAYFKGLAGEEGFSAIDFSEVGIKAIDAKTVEYTLEKPVPYFLSALTYVCYMPAYGKILEETKKEFGTAKDKMYYCGAYYLAEQEYQGKETYKKNALNWDAANVFITTIERTYNAEGTTLAPEMVKRGELDYAGIGSDILDDWLAKEETKNLVSKERPDTSYSYFYIFNFDPQFDAAYEPENWKIAVNNENFRQSVMAALNRLNPVSISEPNVPEAYISNTITPVTFSFNEEKKDYTQVGELAAITARDSFNEAKAVEYRDKAKAELEAAGATFPIKVLMPYNPSTINWDKECQVVKQQLETLLGTDYINIILETGPSDGFLDAVRRNGKYALLKSGWGADYADPETWTDPFYQSSDEDPGFKYAFLRQAMVDKTASADVVAEYFSLVEAAKQETSNLNVRYEAFAKAEAFLINHALAVPYGISISDYIATKLDVFEGQYAPFGVSNLRYKGQHLQENFVSMTQYEENAKK